MLAQLKSGRNQLIEPNRHPMLHKIHYDRYKLKLNQVFDQVHRVKDPIKCKN